MMYEQQISAFRRRIEVSKILEVVGCNNPNRVGDIVFIHGLTGDPRSTWKFVDPSDGGYTFFWPEAIGKDCPHFGVWSIGYESSPTKLLGFNMPMIDRATNILDLFDAYDLGNRPIFFVAHSLGGLLVKAILRHSSELPPEHSKSGVFRNTKGVAFFGTPHTGSGLANIGKAIPGFLPTEIIHELTRGDAYLRDLSNWFAEKAVANGFVCLAYSETRKTRGVIVVDAVSAAPGGVGMRPTPVDADHYSICKIPNQSDQRYKQIQKLLGSLSSPPVLPTLSTHVEGVDISLSVVPDPPKDRRCMHLSDMLGQDRTRSENERMTYCTFLQKLGDESYRKAFGSFVQERRMEKFGRKWSEAKRKVPIGYELQERTWRRVESGDCQPSHDTLSLVSYVLDFKSADELINSFEAWLSDLRKESEKY